MHRKVNIQFDSTPVKVRYPLFCRLLCLCFLNLLTGEEGLENIPVETQSSPEFVNQESETPAVSACQEELHEESPSSEDTCQKNPTSQPQTETSHDEDCHYSEKSQITMDLPSLTSHQSTDKGSLSDSSPTVIDVNTLSPSDACHSEQASETADVPGGRGDDKCTEGGETVETECIIIEEVNSTSSTVASTPTAEEQEDVQSNQETELSDGTDVCVSREI